MLWGGIATRVGSGELIIFKESPDSFFKKIATFLQFVHTCTVHVNAERKLANSQNVGKRDLVL
jgi:hypothetical protein